MRFLSKFLSLLSQLFSLIANVTSSSKTEKKKEDEGKERSKKERGNEEMRAEGNRREEEEGKKKNETGPFRKKGKERAVEGVFFPSFSSPSFPYPGKCFLCKWKLLLLFLSDFSRAFLFHLSC